MTWDEEKMIEALEAKGRTVAANITRRLASGMEARRGETEGLDAKHDSPSDAQKETE